MRDDIVHVLKYSSKLKFDNLRVLRAAVRGSLKLSETAKECERNVDGKRKEKRMRDDIFHVLKYSSTLKFNNLRVLRAALRDSLKLSETAKEFERNIDGKRKEIPRRKLGIFLKRS